ncbi:substrate-binding domain-containing protein [Subtercola boreus]|nr:substrate-binding domain-containing protein [Subtercola boreus]
MLGHERRERILEHLRLYGRVQAAEMAAELHVSEITLRRDLNQLGRDKLLTRTHGGAVRTTSQLEATSRLKIGVIVPMREYYYSEVLRGAASIAESLDARLLIGVSGFGSGDGHPIRHIQEMGVDGLLLTTPLGDADDNRVGEWLSEVTVPTVLMERAFTFPRVSREFDYVRSDHAHGAVIALRHLRELGYESIAVGIHRTPTAYWLEAGVKNIAPALGLEVAHYSLPKEDDPHLYVELGRMLDECLAKGIHAFFMHTDLHASQLVEIALQRGLSVPGDIAIVAYDDVVASLAAVPLTAVAPPKTSIGSTALELLVRRLRRPAQNDEPVCHISLLPTLHIRSSCGASSPELANFISV